MVVWGALCGSAAQAQQTEWVTGTITSVNGTNCSIIGQPYTEIMLQSYASYLRFTDLSAPKTGDGTYVSLVMSVPGLNCNPDSSVGFVPSLVLPPGASLNVTAQTPVRCFFGINGNPSAAFTGTQLGVISGQGTGLRVGPICPDGQGGGVGTPFALGPSGVYGGLALGLQYLPRSSFLEIQVPIRFSKELLGAGGPNGGDRVQYILDSVGLNPSPANVSAWINVPYRALFTPPSASSVTASTASVSSTLSSFFKAGALSVEYGTGGTFSQTSTVTNISNANESQPVNVALGGLSPSTTYNYRFKYVTASGTFTSSTGTFTTGAPANFTVNVTKNGTGTGTVTSAPAGINCGSACSATFTSSVTLTAAPASGSQFVGWSGACTGTALTCTVSGAATVNAQFAREIGSLSYTVNGLPTGSSATLSITRPDGSTSSATVLTGTGQNLSDVVTGAYTVSAPNVTVSGVTYAPAQAVQTVNVTFGATATVNVVYSALAPTTYALTVSKTGAGSGTVTSAPAGVNCGATCTANFNSGSSVTLTATPASGAVFSGWGGACSGTGTCTVTMDSAKTVTANFTPAVNPPPPPPPPPSFALTVTKNGTGSGSVSSTPAGIACGATCSASFAQGVSVTLTPTPASGSVFAGWGGACTGSGACVVAMNAAQNVTATFNTAPVNTFALSVTKTGSGSGAITSAPAGIDCGATCVASFAQGSSVTLTATPASGSAFTAWSGACSGAQATCTVSMDASKTVAANFESNAPNTFALSVTKTGAGTGTVSSTPAGVNCGASCTANFAGGSSVTLNATASSGSAFAGWGGACSGTGACTVIVDAAKSVTATFTSNPSNPPPPPPPPPPSSLAPSAPSNAPQSRTVLKGSSLNPALAFALNLPGGTLSSLTFNLAGTGSASDLTSVRLYVDSDGSGTVSGTETSLASGQFVNGAVTLTPSSAVRLNASSATQFLVTVDVNNTLSGLRVVPILGGLLLLGLGLRRRWLGVVGLAVLLTACPADPPKLPETRTYTLSLQSAALRDANGSNVTLTGLPLAGATLTVER
jgi:hypothetical protein